MTSRSSYTGVSAPPSICPENLRTVFLAESTPYRLLEEGGSGLSMLPSSVLRFSTLLLGGFRLS